MGDPGRQARKKHGYGTVLLAKQMHVVKIRDVERQAARDDRTVQPFSVIDPTVGIFQRPHLHLLIFDKSVASFIIASISVSSIGEEGTDRGHDRRLCPQVALILSQP